MLESEELKKKLDRRTLINETKLVQQQQNQEGGQIHDDSNFHSKFPEFTFKRIVELEEIYHRYDDSKAGRLRQYDLLLLLTEIERPMTFFEMRKCFREADANGDNVLSLEEFMHLAYQLFKENETQVADEITVAETGVLGAKSFFELKVEKLGR